MKPDLRIAPCDRNAADFACRRYHYTGKLPAGKLVHHGVWEDGQFIGSVIYGRGSTPQIGKPFGLKQTEVCELVRVALRDHRTPVSRILAISMRILRRTNPGLRLLISFADSAQGHHGGIYQAGGWTYIGPSTTTNVCLHGRLVHWRTVKSRYGFWRAKQLRERGVDAKAYEVEADPKWKYVRALDPSLQDLVAAKALPYPKRGIER